MLSFKELLKEGPWLSNLTSLGYLKPTPIQGQAIPVILKGADLLGIAQTGTGKTAAFCLPIVQNLFSQGSDHSLRALILAPTRELASQIELSLEKLAHGTDLKSVVLYGGVEQGPQVAKLKKGVDILVATPGRLLDLMEQKQVRLDKIQVLVLDEADRMLDMGFMDDIAKIIESMPVKRQTLFFSATMPAGVVALSKKILVDPVRVEVTLNSSTALNIEQKVFLCKREDKFQLLKKILKGEERELVIVFTKTKISADKVREYLRHHRIATALFHGDKSQEDRERALLDFKNGSMKVLVTTDIAARGIDVPGVSHVINFELPLEAENYIHRIGRTARAGEKGIAISFCDESEMPNLERIQKLLQLKLPSEKFKGTHEAGGKWTQDGPVNQVKAPTPGISQEKSGYIDHSKRQKVAVGEASKAKSHPGFKKKKKKR